MACSLLIRFLQIDIEIRNGPSYAVVNVGNWLPFECLLSKRDIGSASHRVVIRREFIDDPVRSVIFFASSKIVSSDGLPRFIWPVTSSSVFMKLIKASIIPLT